MFARHLERQNREYPARFERSRPDGDRFDRRCLYRPARACDMPRLGDLPALEPRRIERRVRQVYRIDLPLKSGRVLDVLG